eukprot:NODE_29877_length_433_cov_2.954248.p2 GENE.NODE_29877_length_433_cov_2.954248~~NODE_29877_length_433_cov_2.954248.p2  ORF type:complete len:74 (+),score=7.68 NODE_29877_length_433_cov_2.954248:131-352(+)
MNRLSWQHVIGFGCFLTGHGAACGLQLLVAAGGKFCSSSVQRLAVLGQPEAGWEVMWAMLGAPNMARHSCTAA